MTDRTFAAMWIEPYEKGEELGSTVVYYEKKTEIFNLDNPPLIIDQSVPVVLLKKTADGNYSIEEDMYIKIDCIRTFVSVIETQLGKKPYQFSTPPDYKDTELLNLQHTLIWKPGEEQARENEVALKFSSLETEKLFFNRGEWALVKTRDVLRGGEYDLSQTELVWYPVTEDVFVLENTSTYGFLNCNWRIGCENVVEFLEANSLAGFDPWHEWRSGDDSIEDYKKEVESIVVLILDNVIPKEFTRNNIETYVDRHFDGSTTLSIQKIEISYEPEMLTITALETKDGSNIYHDFVAYLY